MTLFKKRNLIKLKGDFTASSLGDGLTDAESTGPIQIQAGDVNIAISFGKDGAVELHVQSSGYTGSRLTIDSEKKVSDRRVRTTAEYVGVRRSGTDQKPYLRVIT